MKFQIVKLLDIVSFRTGKLNSNAAVENGTYPFYTCSKDIYRTNTTAFNTEAVLLGGNNAVGDYPLFYVNGEFDAYQRTYIIEPLSKENLYIRYLYYNLRLRLKDFQSYSTGASTKFLTLRILHNVEINLPTLPTQRRIASILSGYDDLIENNLKRIKLLEEKAFLGYKAIVNNESVEEKKLNQVTQFLKRGISPKYVNEDGVIVLNQKCNRNHIISFEDSRLTDSEKNIPEERMLQKFDTLINSTGTGTLGRIAMNIQDEFPLTADSHITIVRANHEITPIYLCMSLFAMENVIEMMGEGATNQTELSPKKVGEEIKIPLVSNTLMNEYEKQAVPIFNLIWNLQKQNAKLREARDILLPRLMSGEIEV